MELYQNLLDAHLALSKSVFTIRYADQRRSAFLITALAGDILSPTTNIVDTLLVDPKTLTPLDLRDVSDAALVSFANTRSRISNWKGSDDKFPIDSDTLADQNYHKTLALLTHREDDDA